MQGKFVSDSAIPDEDRIDAEVALGRRAAYNFRQPGWRWSVKMLQEPWFWLILGALLVLSEFFATGIVAIFFGVGAILVGVATALGLVSAPAEQIVLFAVLSVAALLLAREKIKVWFRGNVSDRWDGDQDPVSARGARVKVTQAFDRGAGKVRLNGVEWKAECDSSEFEVGDTVWVVGHRGITLLVSPEKDSRA